MQVRALGLDLGSMPRKDPRWAHCHPDVVRQALQVGVYPKTLNPEPDILNLNLKPPAQNRQRPRTLKSSNPQNSKPLKLWP